MKNCELCKVPARIFCESDQASLCWNCDAKVHGANFLVARHSRILLCHACHSPTPWLASGARLGNTVSVCDRCSGEDVEEGEGDNDDEVDREDSDLDEDKDGDNQVVPLSWTPPPPAESFSSSEESVSRYSNGDGDVSKQLTTISLKRQREDSSDHNFQDGPNSSQPQRRYGAEGREKEARLACDGEPPSKASLRHLNGGEAMPASTRESLDRFNVSHSYRDGRASDGV